MLAWDKQNEAEQQEISMAMLLRKPSQRMLWKSRVGRTGPRKDQIGKHWLILATRLQPGTGGDPPPSIPHSIHVLQSCRRSGTAHYPRGGPSTY